MEKSFLDVATNQPTVPFVDEIGYTTGRIVNLVGFRFGPDSCYEFERLYGEGGMGQVWAAAHHQGDTRKRVAIKIVRPERWSAYANDLFKREMRMHKMLGDVEGVVSLRDTGSFVHPMLQVPVHFIVMDWIDAAKPLDVACLNKDWHERVKIMSRVCEIVSSVHARGMVHCDIKPHNILIDNRNRVYLTDFGLTVCNQIESYGDQINSVRGTWAYMAPEQCERGCDPHAFLPALDVYSLGIMFFECLTGKIPYRIDASELGPSESTRELISNGAEIPKRIGRRTLPFSIVKVLRKATDPSPSNRYADAGEMGKELKALVSRSRFSDYITLLGTAAVLSFMLAGWSDSPVNHETIRDWLIKKLPMLPVRDARLDAVAVTISQGYINSLDTPENAEVAARNRLRRLALGKISSKLADAGVTNVAIVTKLAASETSNSEFTKLIEDGKPIHDSTEIALIKSAANRIAFNPNGTKRGNFYIASLDYRLAPDDTTPESWGPDVSVASDSVNFVPMPFGFDSTDPLCQVGIAYVDIPKPSDTPSEQYQRELSVKERPAEISLPVRLCLNYLYPKTDFNANVDPDRELVIFTPKSGNEIPVDEVLFTGIHSISDVSDFEEKDLDQIGNAHLVHAKKSQSVQSVIRSTFEKSHKDNSLLDAERIMNWHPQQIANYIDKRPVLISLAEADDKLPLDSDGNVVYVSQMAAIAVHGIIQNLAPFKNPGVGVLIRQFSYNQETLTAFVSALLIGTLTRSQNRKGNLHTRSWAPFVVVTLLGCALIGVLAWSTIYYHTAYYWCILPWITVIGLMIAACIYLPWWKR